MTALKAWLARNRASVVLGLLLLAGAIIGQSVGERTSDREGPRLSSQDAHPHGALALALWLERLGYPVQRMDGGGSLDDVGVLFILAPVRPFARAEATALADWVRRGGVLVYMPSPTLSITTLDTTSRDALAAELGVESRIGVYAGNGTPAPAFFTAPAASAFTIDNVYALELKDDAWVPLVQETDRVYAATRALGSGRVYAVQSDALFSNARIAERDNAAFVLNVLARAPAGRRIAFEEGHHRLIEAPDLLTVMRFSPWGWAIGYAAIVTFGFMLWGGRRFGPPVVAPVVPARSTGEYIGAFAGLLQRRRATDWLQKRYAALVRRRIATRLGVRADLPPAELARLLAERQPIDQAALAADLRTLDGVPVGERTLLDLVRSMETMLRAGGR